MWSKPSSVYCQEFYIFFTVSRYSTSFFIFGFQNPHPPYSSVCRIFFKCCVTSIETVRTIRDRKSVIMVSGTFVCDLINYRLALIVSSELGSTVDLPEIQSIVWVYSGETSLNTFWRIVVNAFFSFLFCDNERWHCWLLAGLTWLCLLLTEDTSNTRCFVSWIVKETFTCHLMRRFALDMTFTVDKGLYIKNQSILRLLLLGTQLHLVEDSSLFTVAILRKESAESHIFPSCPSNLLACTTGHATLIVFVFYTRIFICNKNTLLAPSTPPPTPPPPATTTHTHTSPAAPPSPNTHTSSSPYSHHP